MIEEKIRKNDDKKEGKYVLFSIFFMLIISTTLIILNSKMLNEKNSDVLLSHDEIRHYTYIDENIFQKNNEIINEDIFLKNLTLNDNFNWINKENKIFAISKNKNIGNFLIKNNKIFYLKKYNINEEELQLLEDKFKEISILESGK